jgi:hypothetical protein
MQQTRRYEFRRAPEGTPVHEFTDGDTQILFYVLVETQSMLISMARPFAGPDPQTSSLKLGFDQVRDLVARARATDGVTKLETHGGGPGDQVRHGEMVFLLFPGDGRPFPVPVVLFTDARWHDGQRHQGIAIRADRLALLEHGQDLNTLTPAHTPPQS